MKKKYLLFLGLFIIFSHSLCFGQRSELGLFLGASTYRGELNPVTFSSDLALYHPAIGLFIRRNKNAYFAYRFNLVTGKVSGDDARSSSAYEKIRNLSFESPVTELSWLVEFNFLPFERYDSPYLLSPYVFTGLSLFHFNPSAMLGGQKYHLQSMKLEGSGYSLISTALPMGVGIKFKVKRWVFSVEAGSRKTSTDYLDNIHGVYLDPNTLSGASKVLADPSLVPAALTITGRQRGNSKNKDWYTFLGITLSHKIGNARKRECELLLKNQ